MPASLTSIPVDKRVFDTIREYERGLQPMAMTDAQRAQTLSQWIKPSSDDEVVQQDRALRMVTEAINGWPAFNGVSKRIYAKGSYANNTNVRRDSDVDIAVECHECMYYDSHQGRQPEYQATSPYSGPWSPAKWRQEVAAAMASKFGAGELDTTGKIAIEVAAVEGSRPSIDVVPAFHFRRYYATSQQDGSCVFPKDGSSKLINWPQQQLENGRRKNDQTGKRYKNFVRALKNAENHLVKGAVIRAKPSYFMECLVWNVNNGTLKGGDLDGGFRATLVELWQGLDSDASDEWEEPNRLKWLFRGTQKWSQEDARELVLETWKELGY